MYMGLIKRTSADLVKHIIGVAVIIGSMLMMFHKSLTTIESRMRMNPQEEVSRVGSSEPKWEDSYPGMGG